MRCLKTQAEAEVRPLRSQAPRKLFPGALALDGDNLRIAYPEPRWLPAPRAFPAHGSVRPRLGPRGRAAAAWGGGGAAAARLPLGPLRAPASPQAQSRSSRVRSQARGRHQQSRLWGGEVALLPEIPQSLLGCGALLTVRASGNPEPGGYLGSGARLRLRQRSRSSASSPHRAPASPLGGLASPRRGAPLARAARPRPRTAPPLGGPAAAAAVAPAAPSRLSAPRRESCF